MKRLWMGILCLLPLWLQSQGSGDTYTYEIIIQVMEEDAPILGMQDDRAQAGALARLAEIVGAPPGALIDSAAHALGRSEDPRLIANRLQISESGSTLTLRFSDADQGFARNFLRELYNAIYAQSIRNVQSQWDDSFNAINVRLDSLFYRIRRADHAGDLPARDSLEREDVRLREKRMELMIERASALPPLQLIQSPRRVH